MVNFGKAVKEQSVSRKISFSDGPCCFHHKKNGFILSEMKDLFLFF
jgi:hypothetical protein